MTNFEHYTSSKYKMAMLLAMIEEDANNYPNEIWCHHVLQRNPPRSPWSSSFLPA